MLFCQFDQAKSLREICYVLSSREGKLTHLGMKGAPKRSTLSYANANRPWERYRGLFYQTLSICHNYAPGKNKFSFKNKLLSIDSSTISLCLAVYPWGGIQNGKASSSTWPRWIFTIICIDIKWEKVRCKTGKKIPLAKGSIVAIDRGYNDY